MLFLLDKERPEDFPDPNLAGSDGLLALGGDLSPARLEAAYRRGIFPWYSEGTPILWWSPDPRCVILPEDFRVPRTVRRDMARFRLTVDAACEDVIAACAAMPRHGEDEDDGAGTWIVPEMIAAYTRLHHAGLVHSVEAWDDEGLAGGLYGVAIGRAFCGESMFHRRSGASKAAMGHLLHLLQERRCSLLDCQMKTDHILRYGAREISRREFLGRLAAAQEACPEIPNGQILDTR